MAFNQIWKQQLALVTYGNEFLSQDLSFHRWVKHPIFNQHLFFFRDLQTQHLLAQHFQVWLEGLKKQGVTLLSLHNSSLLLDEKNPNPNVELLAYSHFIVSHQRNLKTAWICGKELAEWYNSEQDYQAPDHQKLSSRVETMWRFNLNAQHVKRVEADLQSPDWDAIQIYTDNELFDQAIAQEIEKPTPGLRYFGYPQDGLLEEEKLTLLPQDYKAPYANETLLRLDALANHIGNKLNLENSFEADMSIEEKNRLRLFQHKLDELTAKFITKVANHYKSARLAVQENNSPFDEPLTTNQSTKRLFNNSTSDTPSAKSSKSNVFALIFITVLICVLAYYFGL